MSPSYAAPPPGAGPRPPKSRPRKRWFAVGALLLVAAAVVFGVGLWWTLRGATTTDAVVDATASDVGVGVEPGTRRMLYADQDDPVVDCRLTDADGETIELDPSRVDTTVTTEGRTWTGRATFTSATAEITVRCDGPSGALVRIGSPLGGSFAVGIALTILGPLVLGGAGLVVLLVTTVLWLSRPPRQAAPPGRPSPPPPAW